MKFVGYCLIVVGFLLFIGFAGNDDYWEACHRAVDCVAGDPPTFMSQAIQFVIGVLLMLIGTAAISADN
jgi:hypothetical protein